MNSLTPKKHGKLVKVLIGEIEFYQREISPEMVDVCRCRFTPTCSHYVKEALEKHGLVYGGLLSAWRLARCNPLNSGGEDSVPESFSKYVRGYFLRKR